MAELTHRWFGSSALIDTYMQTSHPSLNCDPCRQKTFSLMAGALQQLDGSRKGALRMKLMQGLVKMTWSKRRLQEARTTSRGRTTAGANREPDDGNDSDGTSRMQIPQPQRPATQAESGFQSRERLYSGDSTGWLDVEMESDSDDGRTPSPGLHAAVEDAGSRVRGVQDIFNMPYTEQVRPNGCAQKG